MDKKIVLVVEDNENMQTAIKDRLEFWGFQVLTTANGQAGYDLTKKEKPDLVLLDVMLPEMNGFDICRLIKFDAKTKNIPIVMMTVKAGENDLAQGKAVGADAYLIKPFDFDALHLLINKLLKLA